MIKLDNILFVCIYWLFGCIFETNEQFWINFKSHNLITFSTCKMVWAYELNNSFDWKKTNNLFFYYHSIQSKIRPYLINGNFFEEESKQYNPSYLLS